MDDELNVQSLCCGTCDFDIPIVLHHFKRFVVQERLSTPKRKLDRALSGV